ncbi:hypothetical protein FRC09_016417 [Ceratobasidium sp. 395]|nr:hypothetical protein FRC09_016417 [Ceratobasidium sp. 395]
MISPALSASSQTVRDSEYYFEDGSTVFLVENTLFKIQRSLLALQSEVFRDMFALPNQPNTPISTCFNTEGMNDDNPIVIPGIRAIQFRHLLLYFYGTITDPAYRSLVLDATDESKHNPDAFVKYLHIATLSHRFCFSSVEAWALGQLNRVLQSFVALAEADWTDSNDLLDALAYSKLLADRETEHNVRNLIRFYAYCLSIDANPDSRYKDDPEHLARLYRHPLLKQEDPALFGYVFCVVLRAGHGSVVWTRLNRDELSQLFAAVVHLTPLPSTLPIKWIRDTSEVSEEVDTQLRGECFDNCAQSLLEDFSGGFSHSYLKSNLLYVGLIELTKVADQRHLLERKLRTAECTCAKQLLEVVDLKINTLFGELAEKYHNFLNRIPVEPDA